MAQFRLPRFSRKRDVSPIQLTERDFIILQLVHTHRFLRSSHLTALVSGSSQQLLRRLQLLYHHGFLERPRSQLDYYHRRGSSPIVYGLGKMGTNFLASRLNMPIPTVDWGEKNRSVGRIYLEHALVVSDVMVAIELACLRNALRFLAQSELSRPANGMNGSNFRWRVAVDDAVTLGVVPDRVFGIEYGEDGGRPERAYFFLEADRGTMPVLRRNLSQTSMYRKFRAYEATWSQSIHRSRFGFHRFRMLTVTMSPSRAQSLLEACSKLERGQGLFLFTDITSMKTGGPLSAIWKTTRQNALVGLLK